MNSRIPEPPLPPHSVAVRQRAFAITARPFYGQSPRLPVTVPCPICQKK